MPKKQAFLLVLIVLLPLVALVWLGGRIARNEQAQVRQQLRDLLTEQLKETERVVLRYFQQRERDFLRLTELDSFDAARLRQIIRQQPRMRQLFVLEPDGRLRHPAAGPLNRTEQEFLSRAKVLLADKDLVRAARGELESAAFVQLTSNQTKVPSFFQQATVSTHGWYVWYWGRGLNLIFWRRMSSGHVVGVELERSRWISDLIAELPLTSFVDTPETASRVKLVDSSDQPVYEWGAFEPDTEAQALVEVPLSAPLTAWRLKYFLAESDFAALAGRSTYFNLVAGLTVLGFGLLGLAIYFYRESSRELREAATRVNFVNQVSHELKTPLTNIRMYAELLERDLKMLSPEEATQPSDRLGVIVTESGRLSRLIGNVLTFAKQQRHQIVLKRTSGRVDDVVRAVVQQFEPTFKRENVEVRVESATCPVVQFDADLVEQILVNLFSNVEKYAATGKHLNVTSRQIGDRTELLVSDQGPGIPKAEHERVFQPFFRTSDCLEGPAGAGIGLSIARSLARLHGGDVVLVNSPSGATFKIELHTPPTKDT